MMLLVPCDPLRPSRPDPHFAPEAAAARDAGLTVAVVDHDALSRGAEADRAVARVPRIPQAAPNTDPATASVARPVTHPPTDSVAHPTAGSVTDPTTDSVTHPTSGSAGNSSGGSEAGAGADLGDVAGSVRRVTPSAVPLFVPGAVAVAGADAVYRGWMLRAEQYAAFAAALGRRGYTLRTNAEQYRRAHELPGWYNALAGVTPRSEWTTGFDQAGFDAARTRLAGQSGTGESGAAVLRDYTKSMKHHWHEAAFIPDLADDAAAWAVAQRFRELREDEATGGFVLRRFEDLARAELRTWWIDGVCRLTGAHPDTPDELPADQPDLSAIVPLVAALNLPFVTVDLALRADGVWRVVELGDAQVSDRPASIPAGPLIDLLT